MRRQKQATGCQLEAVLARYVVTEKQNAAVSQWKRDSRDAAPSDALGFQGAIVFEPGSVFLRHVELTIQGFLVVVWNLRRS